MLNLTKLYKITILNENNDELGLLNDFLFNKESGKCLLSWDNGIYEADKLTQKGNGLILTNPQISLQNGIQVIGKKVYDTSGKCLGVMRDATIGKTLNVNKFICDNGEEFTRGRVYAIGDIIIVKNKRTDLKKNKISKEKITEKQITLQNEAATITAVKYPVKRRYGDFGFLVGKTVDKNITNFYDEVMIHCGETVTADVLKQAKLSGKLIELCLHVI